MKKNVNKHNKILLSILYVLSILPIKVHANELADTMSEASRSIFFSIDNAIYSFFSQIFSLFFSISKSQFLTGSIYTIIFKRVFLILGIFMLFRLVFSFLTYLISPDSINDPKNPGNMSKLIGRVIASVLFLVVLVPIGTDTQYATYSELTEQKKGFEGNIQEQGILFGTLQSVQDTILNTNVLGKLILGSQASKFDNVDANGNSTQMNDIGNGTAITVFSAFFRINPNVVKTGCDSDINADSLSENYIIPSLQEAGKWVQKKCTNGEYLFDYDVFVSTIVGLIVTVIVFLFTFDVALRSIKLAILRMISPIPAISYISPKSSKEGAFANYTKTLMSTYLDLFLRIAIIYLVVLLISAISSGQSDIIGGSQYSGMSKVIIIIALLFFAAQAPRFIMQALGIKSNGTGLGFGAALLGGALAGGFAGATTGGLAGAVKGFFGGAAAGSQNQWAAQNGQRPNMSARQAALNRGAQLGSGDPNAKGMGVGSFITGGIGNLLTGTNMHNLDKQKKQFFNDQRDLGDRERIASNLGYGHNLTNQDWQFLEKQKYENGNDIVRNTGGVYEFLDSNGNVLTRNDDMSAALAFDNSEKKKNLGRRQDDLEKAKKQNAYHDPRAMKPKFTAFKRRYKGK